MANWYRNASTIDRGLAMTAAGALGIALVMSYAAVVSVMVYG